jgi:hypothetical protein
MLPPVALTILGQAVVKLEGPDFRARRSACADKEHEDAALLRRQSVLADHVDQRAAGFDGA